MWIINIKLKYKKPSKYATSAVTCKASRKASKSTKFDSLHGAPPQYYCRSQGLMSKLGTTDCKKDGTSMRKAKANILKELVNYFISGLYNNKLRQFIHDSND
jgi:hypothetical protein